MAEVSTNGQLKQYLEDGGVTYLWVKSSKDGKHERKDLKDCDFLDKHCGIYFSAHWCPPCRQFTPKLAKKYDLDISENLTIIFASWDRDVNAFNSYYAEHPWAAIPFEFKESLNKSKAFDKPRGIPALYLFDDKGSLYQKNGRSMVMDFEFPYTDPKLQDIFPLVVDNVAGEVTDQDALSQKKYIMLYFSAHWCPPCRSFTPKLGEWYKKFKKTRDDFELIFVSSDESEKDFKEYFGTMPFKALGKHDSKYGKWISNECGVRGIPCLSIVDTEGNVICKNARSHVDDDNEGKGVGFPWPILPIQNINETVEGINEKPSMILLCDDHDAGKQEELIAMMQPHANDEHGLKDARKMMHFVLKEEGDIAGRVRELLGLTKKEQGLVVLHIQKGQYHMVDLPKSSACVQKFADEFHQGVLPAKKLKMN